MTELLCSTTGKVMLTRSQAASSAKWWRRARFARMQHYSCRHCDTWHIGNNRRPSRRRVRW